MKPLQHFQYLHKFSLLFFALIIFFPGFIFKSSSAYRSHYHASLACLVYAHLEQTFFFTWARLRKDFKELLDVRMPFLFFCFLETPHLALLVQLAYGITLGLR